MQCWCAPIFALLILDNDSDEEEYDEVKKGKTAKLREPRSEKPKTKQQVKTNRQGKSKEQKKTKGKNALSHTSYTRTYVCAWTCRYCDTHVCTYIVPRAIFFLGAATGSPNIVFISRFCCMASCYGNIIYTTMEARLWRASLLRRAGNSAQVMALRWRWFGDSASTNVHAFLCSNGRPCTDGASSQGKQGNMTVVHWQPCHVSAPSNSASNEQWG